ncbi:hypothetical protein NQ317_011104 [Molorchus minor]|uniref:Uncharacterized protein n=1 Tax=Molorchus minor TaxID=1323400 RepID=A0ABQ9K1N2_9CUCU|nr:hypothetical protein NQ317_011104 [Molorchus minor]
MHSCLVGQQEEWYTVMPIGLLFIDDDFLGYTVDLIDRDGILPLKLIFCFTPALRFSFDNVFTYILSSDNALFSAGESVISSSHVVSKPPTIGDGWKESNDKRVVVLQGMQLGSGKLQHTSVISVNHADADQPPSLYLAPTASQNYLFGSLTDGTYVPMTKLSIGEVNKTHVVWIYFVVLILRLYLPRKNAIMNFHNNHVQAKKTLQEVGGARYQHLSLSTRRGIVNE